MTQRSGALPDLSQLLLDTNTTATTTGTSIAATSDRSGAAVASSPSQKLSALGSRNVASASKEAAVETQVLDVSHEELAQDFFQAYAHHSAPTDNSVGYDGGDVGGNDDVHADEDRVALRRHNVGLGHRGGFYLDASPSHTHTDSTADDAVSLHSSSLSSPRTDVPEGMEEKSNIKTEAEEGNDEDVNAHSERMRPDEVETEEDTIAAARQAMLSLWPHPCPPPRAAQPALGQSRIHFHSHRYGAFVETYCALSGNRNTHSCNSSIGDSKTNHNDCRYDTGGGSVRGEESERQQAQRLARSICTIGVSRQPHARGGCGTAVKTTRAFLRHSVLAVEGDSVFAELVERAELLYAAECQRAQMAADALWKAHSGDSSTVDEANEEDCAQREGRSKQQRDTPFPRAVLMRAYARNLPAKLPRVTDPLLRPNARCIALHYGLPPPPPQPPQPHQPQRHTVSSENEDATAGTGLEAKRESASRPYHQRATLIAVISTTRIEAGEEIYVSLESYYRCLDEATWHRVRYGDEETDDTISSYEDRANNPIVGGDVYSGVRRFLRWPTGLAYYHGVGQLHRGSDGDDGKEDATTGAQGAFPFTLLNLTSAPELGPAVATRKVEELVTASASNVYGGGGFPSPTTRRPPASNSKLRASSKAKREEGEVVEDDSGVTAERLDARKRTHEADTVDFALDDTYALGLGRHAVCFGQGIARYINHRYNTSRHGNVELCSVMLPVKSEFSALPRESARQRRGDNRPRSANGLNERVRDGRNGDGGGFPVSRASPTVAATKRVSRRGAVTARATRSARQLRGREGAIIAAGARLTSAVVAKLDSNGVDGEVWTRAEGASGGCTALNEPRVRISAAAAAAAAADAIGHAGEGNQSRAGERVPRPSQRRRPLRRGPSLFLEEHSHFITIPFFIATTDIDAGTPLLAWTYGEEYDAKLERVAVADGALVPYADAAVLNCRRLMGEAETGIPVSEAAAVPGTANHALSPSSLAPPSVVVAAKLPGPTSSICNSSRQWQRYGGDYRYALSVGDVVWRRRPVHAKHGSSHPSGATWCPCGTARCQLLCPPPEVDIFLVVKLQKDAADYALLLPLMPVPVPPSAMRAALKAQDLLDYRAPFPRRAAYDTGEKMTADSPSSYGAGTAITEPSRVHRDNDPDNVIKTILGARLYSRTPSAASSPSVTPVRQRRRDSIDNQLQQQSMRKLPNSEESGPVPHFVEKDWLLYDTQLHSRSAYTDPHRLLRTCVVASTDTLGLLLADTDYVALRKPISVSGLRTKRNRRSRGGSPRSPNSLGGSGRSSSPTSSWRRAPMSSTGRRQILVHLDDLHHSTSLVRQHAVSCNLPPLANGLLWPMFEPSHRCATVGPGGVNAPRLPC